MHVLLQALRGPQRQTSLNPKPKPKTLNPKPACTPAGVAGAFNAIPEDKGSECGTYAHKEPGSS